MLQISSGKFFKTDKLYVSPHVGVLYTNYILVNDLQTTAGSLRRLQSVGGMHSVVYEGEEKLEAVRHDGTPEFLFAVGGGYLLQDFAAVASFLLRITCTPDHDLARRLTAQPRQSPGAALVPSSYVSRVFDAKIAPSPGDQDALQDFIAALVGLERRNYESAMRAVRRYVTALHRVADDLELAYTMLVASIESLAQNLSDSAPTWAEYPAARRHPVDAALEETSASPETATRIRAVLLGQEHHSLGRRYREFILSNLDATYFRQEAQGQIRPASRVDLDRMLDNAYAVGSSRVDLQACKLEYSIVSPK